MAEPTTKQRRYRDDLVTLFVAQARDPNDYLPKEDPDAWVLRTSDKYPSKFLDAALVLALPNPDTAEEMRAQLDCLAPDRLLGDPIHRTGPGPLAYAREHRDWAEPILARLAERWGQHLERAPATVTVAELRAVVTPGAAS